MKILLFGATGSIGKQTIEVINHLGYDLVGISYYSNNKEAQKIIKSQKVKYFYSPISHSSVKSYDELIRKSKPNLIVNAIIGFAGLEITLLSIKHKINLALANKESLVVAGQFVNKLAKQNKVKIWPIDSEHSAIYQAIGGKQDSLKTIYITASGGPFYKKKNISNVTYQQAINHPNWNMGPKISIDSATLMNKCFEIIEAYWLFNTKNIVPIYHPQSIVHSMVEYKDNSIVAIMSNPDMRLPIQLAITEFKTNISSINKVLSFANLNLSFDLIDENKYLPIKWAKKVLNQPNSSLPIVLNAANETAIELFEQKKIKFDQIIKVINFTINKIKIIRVSNIQQIYIIDQLVRDFVKNNYK